MNAFIQKLRSNTALIIILLAMTIGLVALGILSYSQWVQTRNQEKQITLITQQLKDANALIEQLQKEAEPNPAIDLQALEYAQGNTIVSEQDGIKSTVNLTTGKVNISGKTFDMAFEYPASLGQPKIDFGSGAEECGDAQIETGGIGFAKSPITLAINPCGLGGIEQVNVGQIKVTTKNGKKFSIPIDNCNPVPEAGIGGDPEQNCRGYFGGHRPAQKDSVLFLFISTADAQATDTANIRQIVQTMNLRFK
jgi:hypothetical protein